MDGFRFKAGDIVRHKAAIPNDDQIVYVVLAQLAEGCSSAGVQRGYTVRPVGRGNKYPSIVNGGVDRTTVSLFDFEVEALGS